MDRSIRMIRAVPFFALLPLVIWCDRGARDPGWGGAQKPRRALPLLVMREQRLIEAAARR